MVVEKRTTNTPCIVAWPDAHRPLVVGELRDRGGRRTVHKHGGSKQRAGSTVKALNQNIIITSMQATLDGVSERSGDRFFDDKR